MGQSVRDTVLVFGLALMALAALAWWGRPAGGWACSSPGAVITALTLLKALATPGRSAIARCRWCAGWWRPSRRWRWPASLRQRPLSRAGRIAGAVLGLCGVIGFLPLLQPGPAAVHRLRPALDDLRPLLRSAPVLHHGEVLPRDRLPRDVRRRRRRVPRGHARRQHRVDGQPDDAQPGDPAPEHGPGSETAIAGAKARFTPERWAAYKQDSRYLREAMGTNEFFAMMRDHGANATPVWMSIAYLLFNNLAPSDGASSPSA